MENETNGFLVVTLIQLLQHYPAFTESGVRAWLFYNKDNFRSKCTMKVGSRILFDLDAVNAWLDSHRGGDA